MREGRKVFFSEEKNQKTFISPRDPRSRPWPESETSAELKVFWFFFSKKNILSSFAGH
jgi:ribosomal protein L24E